MSNILFNKIPLDKFGGILLEHRIVSNIHNSIQKALDENFPEENYLVITSPTDLTKIDGNAKIITIDCKEYSANELIEIIEKVNMYDGLYK